MKGQGPAPQNEISISRIRAVPVPARTFPRLLFRPGRESGPKSSVRPSQTPAPLLAQSMVGWRKGRSPDRCMASAKKSGRAKAPGIICSEKRRQSRLHPGRYLFRAADRPMLVKNASAEWSGPKPNAQLISFDRLAWLGGAFFFFFWFSPEKRIMPDVEMGPREKLRGRKEQSPFADMFNCLIEFSKLLDTRGCRGWFQTSSEVLVFRGGF